jgi:hypothetical protein
VLRYNINATIECALQFHYAELQIPTVTWTSFRQSYNALGDLSKGSFTIFSRDDNADSDFFSVVLLCRTNNTYTTPVEPSSYLLIIVPTCFGLSSWTTSGSPLEDGQELKPKHVEGMINK